MKLNENNTYIDSPEKNNLSNEVLELIRFVRNSGICELEPYKSMSDGDLVKTASMLLGCSNWDAKQAHISTDAG